MCVCVCVCVGGGGNHGLPCAGVGLREASLLSLQPLHVVTSDRGAGLDKRPDPAAASPQLPPHTPPQLLCAERLALHMQKHTSTLCR